MRKLWILCVLFTNMLFGAKPIDIKVNIKGLLYDTIWFGQTYGRKSHPEFHALRSGDGSFYLKSDKSYEPGIYCMIFKLNKNAGNSYVTLLIEEDQGSFTIDCNAANMNNSVVFTNSYVNSKHYEYKLALAELNTLFNVACEKYRISGLESDYRAMIGIEHNMNAIKEKFIGDNPPKLLAHVIKHTAIHVPPLEIEWLKHKKERHSYYLGKFLKNWDVNDPLFWSSPLSIDWLDHMVFKAAEPDPKIGYEFVNKVIEKLKENPEAFKYYINYMLNSFEKMTQFSFDQIYVELVRDYVVTGKCPWLTEEQFLKHRDTAANIERVSIGQKAEDATFYTEENTPISVYGLKSKYKMLIFWHPDCGHCKKELPMIKRLSSTIMAKDVAIMAICLQKADLIQSCWGYVNKTAELPKEWHHVADPNNTSRFRTKYNVTSYPMMLILDSENKIVIKRKGEVDEMELMKIIEKL